jgi:hypothetical protein
MAPDTWNRCMYCGRFISFEAFENKQAFVVLTRTPLWDGDFDETTNAFHKKCREMEKALGRIVMEE